MKGLALILAAGLLAACTARPPGPPDLVVDRTPCSHCGMLISDPIYAAAFEAPGAPARVFDDIGCLLAAARETPGPGVRFWFHDAAAGGWIDGASAVFAASPQFRTPMGGGVLAYATHAEADAAASTHQGRIVPTLSALLAREGGTQ